MGEENKYNSTSDKNINDGLTCKVFSIRQLK